MKAAELKTNELQALEEFVTAVRTALGPAIRRIALFGSKARGHDGPFSDLDVLVIVGARSKQTDQVIRDAAFEIGLARDVLLSPVIF